MSKLYGPDGKPIARLTEDQFAQMLQVMVIQLEEIRNQVLRGDMLAEFIYERTKEEFERLGVENPLDLTGFKDWATARLEEMAQRQEKLLSEQQARHEQQKNQLDWGNQ